MIVYLVLTTCSADHAGELGRRIVTERWAACCNQLPGVTSTYWWQGELQNDTEVLLLFKTSEESLPSLMERLQAYHPYDLPEILAFRADEGLEGYMRWVADETRRG